MWENTYSNNNKAVVGRNGGSASGPLKEQESSVEDKFSINMIKNEINLLKHQLK